MAKGRSCRSLELPWLSSYSLIMIFSGWISILHPPPRHKTGIHLSPLDCPLCVLTVVKCHSPLYILLSGGFLKLTWRSCCLETCSRFILSMLSSYFSLLFFLDDLRMACGALCSGICYKFSISNTHYFLWEICFWSYLFSVYAFDGFLALTRNVLRQR